MDSQTKFEIEVDDRMTAHMALAEKKDKVWELCKEFITDQTIRCAYTISDCDRVMSNAYEFIEGMCDIVGYYKDSDD